MGRVIRFAIATAMRQDEIFRIEWPDVDLRRKVVTVRDRKDPRRKDGNDQRVPLLNLTGFDAWTVVLEQKIVTRGVGRVFPHHSESAGTAFRRGCRELGIEDLHFHDLRHEATSRLFEAGLTIEVALVTGHKDWRMLRRYTHLKPEDLLRLQKRSVEVIHTMSTPPLPLCFLCTLRQGYPSGARCRTMLRR
jgi:integrase